MSGGADRESAELAAFRRHRARIAADAELSPSRIGILETTDGLGIYNPSRRSWPLVVFLVAWLSGWSAGEYFALTQIVGAPLPVAAFLAIWLSLWTIAGVGVAGYVLWQLGGAELLFLTSGSLVLELRFLGLTRRVVASLEDVTDLGPIHQGSPAVTLRPGKVRFTVAGKPTRFGIGLSDEEARAVLAAIESHLSRQRPNAERAAKSP